MRLPPTLKSQKAAEVVTKLLTENPPYGAEVTLVKTVHASGWNAPPNKEYLDSLLTEASKNFFGKEALYYGEGGSIPFINFLGTRVRIFFRTVFIM